MIRALVAKDVRLLRPLLLTAAALAVLLWAVLATAAYVRVRHEWSTQPPHDLTYRPTPLAAAQAAVVDGTVWSAVAGLVLFAALGGTAFAVERRERWADWQAMLPVSRRRTVAVKLATAVAAGLALAAVDASVSILADRSSYGWTGWARVFGLALGVRDGVAVAAVPVATAAGVAWLLRRSPAGLRYGGAALAALVVAAAWLYAVDATLRHGGVRGGHWWEAPAVRNAEPYVPVALALFGVAWLLSTSMRSAATATALAIAVTGGGLFWANTTLNPITYGIGDSPADWRVSAAREAAFERGLDGVAGGLGVACVVAGCVVQARRVSP